MAGVGREGGSGYSVWSLGLLEAVIRSEILPGA